MIALVLILLAAPAKAPACYADGHNQHRNKAVIKQFRAEHPCPQKCATYRFNGQKFYLYQRCGACQVDHVCPLACCGPDTLENLQWLTSEENRKKSADCSACQADAMHKGKL